MAAMTSIPASGRKAPTHALRWACQTYTWQMDLARYRGRIQEISRAVAAAGFTGLEPEVVMLGENWRAADLLGTLHSDGLALAALCLVENWRSDRELPEEAERADLAIDAVAAATADGAILTLCQHPGADRRDLADRQRRAIASMIAVAGRAAERGVHCSVHANSPAGSVFRTAEDYELLLSSLPPEIGFTPDVGHIAAAGIDPLDLIRRHQDRVDHVHFKDIAADGSWTRTGEGTVDFPGIVELLAGSGFSGWIVMEDESPEAAADPVAAAGHTAAYARGVVDRMLG